MTKTQQGIGHEGSTLTPIDHSKESEKGAIPDFQHSPPAPKRSPNREPKIIIKEQIEKLSNSDLKEIAAHCEQIKKTRKAKAEAEFKELE